MRYKKRKLFWVWNFDKEEKWLNEMAAKGLALVSVGFCKYEFEDSEPGEYSIRMELLEKAPTTPEGRKYIEFVESTGAEQVSSLKGWVYFRKKVSDGEFEMFSDNESRVKHLTRIIRPLLIVLICNMYMSAWNFYLSYTLDSSIKSVNMITGCLCLAVCLLLLLGILLLAKKRKRLKNEQRVFE